MVPFADAPLLPPAPALLPLPPLLPLLLLWWWCLPLPLRPPVPFMPSPAMWLVNAPTGDATMGMLTYGGRMCITGWIMGEETATVWYMRAWGGITGW